MQILEVKFRNHIERDHTLESHARKWASHLDQVCDHIDRCEVTFEHPHKKAAGYGGEYSVRIDLTVAPGHEFVTRERSADAQGLALATRKAFRVSERRLKSLVAKQRGAVKYHPDQRLQGIVTKLFDDHGFVELEGRELYFHKNSVLGTHFDDLRVGAGVAITWEDGREGPHATSLRVVDSRGHEPLAERSEDDSGQESRPRAVSRPRPTTQPTR